MRRRCRQQHVAVGIGARHDALADRAAGAGFVFDDELLAKLAAEPVKDDPRNDIGGAARTERNDDPDRLVGPIGGESR